MGRYQCCRTTSFFHHLHRYPRHLRRQMDAYSTSRRTCAYSSYLIVHTVPALIFISPYYSPFSAALLQTSGTGPTSSKTPPRLLESLLRRLPVHDIPNSAKVLRLAILVLQVVRVLPRINAQNGTELTHHGVLVRICLDLDRTSVGILYQPCPTRTLNPRQSSVELGFELVQ